jgi:hypothetical protein
MLGLPADQFFGRMPERGPVGDRRGQGRFYQPGQAENLSEKQSVGRPPQPNIKDAHQLAGKGRIESGMSAHDSAEHNISPRFALTAGDAFSGVQGGNSRFELALALFEFSATVEGRAVLAASGNG